MTSEREPRYVGRLADPEFRRARAAAGAQAAHAKRALIEYHVAAIEKRAGELSDDQRKRLRTALRSA